MKNSLFIVSTVLAEPEKVRDIVIAINKPQVSEEITVDEIFSGKFSNDCQAADPRKNLIHHQSLIQMSMVEDNGESDLEDLSPEGLFGDDFDPEDFDAKVVPMDMPEMDDDFLKVMNELPTDFEE